MAIRYSAVPYQLCFGDCLHGNDEAPPVWFRIEKSRMDFQVLISNSFQAFGRSTIFSPTSLAHCAGEVGVEEIDPVKRCTLAT